MTTMHLRHQGTRSEIYTVSDVEVQHLVEIGLLHFAIQLKPLDQSPAFGQPRSCVISVQNDAFLSGHQSSSNTT